MAELFRTQYIEIPGDLLLNRIRSGIGCAEMIIKLPEVALDLNIDTKWGTHPRLYFRKYVEDPEETERHIIFVETGTIFEMDPTFNYLGSIHLYNDTIFLHVYIDDPSY